MYDSDPRRVDEKRLRELLWQDNPKLKNVEIAAIMGINRKTVSRYRSDWKAPLSPNGTKNKMLPDDEVFKELHSQKVPVPRQARMLRLSKRQVQYARKRLELRYSDGVQPYPQEMYDACEAMLDDGMSFAEIQRTLKISEHFLRDHFPGRGWTPQQAAQLRSAKRQARRAGLEL